MNESLIIRQIIDIKNIQIPNPTSIYSQQTKRNSCGGQKRKTVKLRLKQSFKATTRKGD